MKINKQDIDNFVNNKVVQVNSDINNLNTMLDSIGIREGFKQSVNKILLDIFLNEAFLISIEKFKNNILSNLVISDEGIK